MTRTDLLTKLARRLNKNTTLDSATQNRLLDHLNNRHREILSWPGMQILRQRRLTFASVANQSLYGLANVERVITIGETDNDRILMTRSFDEYRAVNPDPASTTGTPDYYVPLGYQQVALQPSNASEIFVKSSSAADTTQTCFVEGFITGGYPRTASVTLNGTTAVSLGATITTWIGIDKFYLSATPAGAVTLHEDSGVGTELARIGIGQTWQQYLGFHLDPTPSSAITYTVDALMNVTDFAQANDQPLLPQTFHDMLVYGGEMDEFVKTDDPRYQAAERNWVRRGGDLKLHVARLSTGMGMAEQRSSLGSWYPSGS